MRIEYDGDPTRSVEERPRASVVHFDEATPTTEHASDVGCNFGHRVWRYEFPDSRWFDGLELVELDPGAYTAVQSPRAGGEPVRERVLRVFAGSGVLRTERADVEIERFDHVAVPTGAAFQVGNTGTDPLWVGSWYSTGETDASAASTPGPGDGTGIGDGIDARAAYERFVAERADRGLPTPPEYDPADASGDVDRDEDAHTEPSVEAFADVRPKARLTAPEVGCNADWLAWMTNFDALEWISDSSVMKLEPGGYTSLHTHFDNEGPHEEIYWVMQGDARLVTEYRDVQMRRFDCAFFPTGNPHAIGNAGTDTLWVAAWGARGGVEGDFDVADLEISERPGQVEEYERAMAARKQRGLSLPPNVEVEVEDG